MGRGGWRLLLSAGVSATSILATAGEAACAGQEDVCGLEAHGDEAALLQSNILPDAAAGGMNAKGTQRFQPDLTKIDQAIAKDPMKNMKLRGVFVLKFKPDVTEVDKMQLMMKMSELVKKIPEAVAVKFGPDAGLDPENNFDMVVGIDCYGDEKYKAIVSHPEYVKFEQEELAPMLAPDGLVTLQVHPAPG